MARFALPLAVSAPKSGLPKQRVFGLLFTLCLAVTVLSLVGHFIADASIGDQLATSTLHTGLALPPVVALGNLIALALALVCASPNFRPWFSPPLPRPPVPLH